MRRLPADHRLAPWAGAVVGPAGWYAQQQGLGQLTYFACEGANAATVALSGVLVLAALAAAGAWSFAAWRAGAAPPAFDNRRFVALASLMAVGVFGLAVVFQTLAGLIVPGCAR